MGRKKKVTEKGFGTNKSGFCLAHTLHAWSTLSFLFNVGFANKGVLQDSFQTPSLLAHKHS